MLAWMESFFNPWGERQIMSKVNCEAVGKRRQASLRMARAELLQEFVKKWKNMLTNEKPRDNINKLSRTTEKKVEKHSKK